MTQALDGTTRSDYEEIVIDWQQKLFNRVYMRTMSFLFPILSFIQFEFEKYGRDIGPYKTALEQKYFDEIEKMK